MKGVAVAAAFRATVSALLLYVADPALQPGLSLTGQGVGLYHQVMPRGDTGVPLQILTSAATEPDAGLASLVLIWLIPLSALIVGCPCHSLRSVQALGTFTSKSHSLARPLPCQWQRIRGGRLWDVVPVCCNLQVSAMSLVPWRACTGSAWRCLLLHSTAKR